MIELLIEGKLGPAVEVVVFGRLFYWSRPLQQLFAFPLPKHRLGQFALALFDGSVHLGISPLGQVECLHTGL